MRKQRHSGKPKSKTRGKAKKARVKMRILGLPIDIPPELDLSAGAPFEGRDQPATVRIPEDIQEMLGPLVEMATNAWRLKVRMVDPDTGEPKEETRKLYRFVEGLFRALDDAGIQVIDKTGKPYDNGMSEKVISFEQTPGLAKEEIVNTVRPSIRWKERLLHHGEIIVGIPVVETPPEETPTTETDSAPSEAATEPAQAADTVDVTSIQSGELPGPEENGSLDASESDAVATDTQSVATQNDSEPDQPETAVSENPVGQESQGDGAEDESAPARPEDTQEPPVALTIPEQSEISEQEGKERSNHEQTKHN